MVCNYGLDPNRIGGMDRFFVAFDKKLKSENYQIDWFFTNYTSFDFYQDLDIFNTKGKEVTTFFLDKTQKSNTKYDFLITHFVPLCIPFFKKAKKLGVQEIIVVDHNPRPLDGFSISKIIKNKIKGLFYSQYINQFIGVSQYTKNQILKDYGSFLHHKTKVIYNGVDANVFKKRNDNNFGKFIVTSHLRPSKGIQDLINAVEILPLSVKNQITIDVFGTGPMEQELKQSVFDKNLQNIFSFKGSSSNLNNLFCNYSYLIQPTHMECFSLSILESLSANVPVITTTVGGNLEIITHNRNGFIFEPLAVEALAMILQNIMTNTIQIQTNTSDNIHNHFNLEKMVDNHYKILKDAF